MASIRKKTLARTKAAQRISTWPVPPLNRTAGVVRNISNKVVVLQNGEVVEQGETVDLFQNPKTEYTKNLIRSIPVVSNEEENIKP